MWKAQLQWSFVRTVGSAFHFSQITSSAPTLPSAAMLSGSTRTSHTACDAWSNTFSKKWGRHKSYNNASSTRKSMSHCRSTKNGQLSPAISLSLTTPLRMKFWCFKRKRKRWIWLWGNWGRRVGSWRKRFITLRSSRKGFGRASIR